MKPTPFQEKIKNKERKMEAKYNATKITDIVKAQKEMAKINKRLLDGGEI